jgi:hypothetical protein
MASARLTPVGRANAIFEPRRGASCFSTFCVTVSRHALPDHSRDHLGVSDLEGGATATEVVLAGPREGRDEYRQVPPSKQAVAKPQAEGATC